MAGQTPRFDLNFFGGDVEGSLGDDDAKFTGEDRLTLDTVLAALEAHTHRVPNVLAAPVAIPALHYDAGDGELQGGTTYFYVLSYVTDDGLETVPGPENSIATPALLSTPSAPQGETTAGGTLSPGSYYYAITGLRDDEESAISPVTAITVLQDAERSVVLNLPALGDADTFQVWRMKTTDPSWTRVGTATVAFTDTGSVPASLYGDPANIPPTSTRGADNYSITITLTGADVADVQNTAGWRIYRSTVSGVYGAASLIHEVVERTNDLDPTTPLLTAWVDDGDVPLTGTPKLSSNQLAVPAFTFEAVTTLPATTGYPLNYPILDGAGTLYVNRTGTWTPIGGSGGGAQRGAAFMGAWDSAFSTSPGYLWGDIVTDSAILWQAVAPLAGGQPSTNTYSSPFATVGAFIDLYVGRGTAYAQSVQFTAVHTLASIDLFIVPSGSTDPITLTLAAGSPSGTPLATSVLADPSIVAGGWVNLLLSTSIPVTTTDVYYVVVTGGSVITDVNAVDGPALSGDVTTPNPLQVNVGYTSDPGYALGLQFHEAAVPAWTLLDFFVPPGGTTGQILTKNSGIDGDFGWATA